MMKMGFIASVLAVTLMAGAAGSAFAAPPGPPPFAPRDALRSVAQQLNAIDMELTWVLQRQPNQYDLREMIAVVNFLTQQVNQEENRLEFLLAQEPVPYDARVTADLENALAAANSIAQEAGNALELNGSTWPAGLAEAVSNVGVSAENVVNVVQAVLGGGIPS